jgi:four helix bundle protein
LGGRFFKGQKKRINKRKGELVMNQRLICYQLLVDVAKAMPGMIRTIPKGDNYLGLQLKRALSSAILNLAEGNGRYTTKERNRFFDFALGSISEVTGAIEFALAFGYMEPKLSQSILAKLRKSYFMIRKLKK